MEYMLLIHADPKGFESQPPSQKAEALAAYGAYTEALAKAGVLRNTHRLRPADMATTVRLVSGKTEVHNGPFAETREQLGGFYLVEAEDLDAAIAIARKVPLGKDGAIEVRPVLPMPPDLATKR